jgi:SHS2 domain-containing protein
MSAINSLHQANAQVIGQIQKLAEVAVQGERALTDQAVKIAKLAAEQKIEATEEASNQSSLDILV